MRTLVMVMGAALAAAAFAVACGDNGNSGPATPSTGTPVPNQTVTPPEEALRLFVQRRLNQGFVSDCDEAERPDDVGKQCARLRGERNGLLAYELGPTFAEYTRLLILQQTADGWTIARQETRDPDQPPVPGIPWPLEVGVSVVVAGTTPDCLKIRQAPGLSETELDCIEDGTVVTTVGGPNETDEIEWWQLEGLGWAAGNYLRYPEEAPTPEPTPEE